MRIVVLTGLSGAGRTAALRDFEDLGYFGVDNLPPALLPDLAERCRVQGDIEQVAVVIDLRVGQFFADLPEALEELRKAGFEVEILFLDSTEEALIQRFKSTRRKHPLFAEGGSVANSIQAERIKLAELRGVADRILDTTRLTPRDLAQDIRANYATSSKPGLHINVVSFGFLHGIPTDADLVFDLRFLRNPHWDQGLRPKTGQDHAVQAYIFEDPRAEQFIQHIQALLAFAVPCYIDEGKAYLTIGIGCTGGQHRSVCFGERIKKYLDGCGFNASLHHRELMFAQQ